MLTTAVSQRRASSNVNPNSHPHARPKRPLKSVKNPLLWLLRSRDWNRLLSKAVRPSIGPLETTIHETIGLLATVAAIDIHITYSRRRRGTAPAHHEEHETTASIYLKLMTLYGADNAGGSRHSVMAMEDRGGRLTDSIVRRRALHCSVHRPRFDPAANGSPVTGDR